jgi:dihydroneopterin aldolase
MGILASIDRCVNQIPKDLVENKILYLELDKKNYELVQEEIEVVTGSDVKLIEQKVDDIGKSIVLNYNDYKIVIIVNKDKEGLDTFYVAFKTKIL